MAGFPDKTKRLAVRGLLVQEKWQRASDREVAREAQVSRQLVAAVRWQMICEGTHPEHVGSHNPWADDPTPIPGSYQPGSKVRGGYVRGPAGDVIRDTEWERLKRKANRKKLERAKKGRQKGG